MLSLPIQDLLDLLKTFYDQYGYAVVFLSSLLENTAIVGFLMPGNSLVLLGAVYARLGTLNLGLVILLASLGTIIGYHCDYLLGRFFLGNIAAFSARSRWGNRLRLSARMRLARRLLQKNGGRAILISHLVGSLRSIVAIGAGFTRMSYITFLFYEVIAAVLWNTLYALIGYFVAMEIDRLATLMQQTGGLIFLVVLGVYLLWRRFGPGAKQRLHRKQRRLARRRVRDMVA